jgi:hypothetical protein
MSFPARLKPALIAVAIPLAIASCTKSVPATSPASPVPGSSAPPGSSAAAVPSGTPGSTGPATASAGGCSADYCAPADWDTAKASTPLPQIPPFSEPLNVIIGARSTVPLTDIQQALGNWKTVTPTTTVSVAGIRLKCISAEQANVTGRGYQDMRQAWRLGGCLHGNELSLSGNEDHARFWSQPVAGSKYGAWFVAASYETMCIVKDGQLTMASAHKTWTALHPGAAYHCVDGGPGTFHVTHPSGYDDAARDFAAAIATAGKAKGWRVAQRVVNVSHAASAGEGGVPFSDAVYVVTVIA